MENSSKQISSAEKLKTEEEEEEAEPDLSYGCCGCRPKWLQWLNNIGGIVAFLSLANCFVNMANAVVGVMLSTLEKRFGFSSGESSWIASAYEIGPIPSLIIVSYFGNRIHRPHSVGFGLLCIAIGCVLFFIPQFTTPNYNPSREGSDSDRSLCQTNSNRTDGCEDDSSDNLSNYLPLFIVARLLIGFGSTPILTLGVTFMDDCSTRGKFATYVGIFNAMSVFGPGLAFVGGGFLLNVFVDFYSVGKDEIDYDTSDSRWIGAWWLPYTVTAGLCLINAVPMIGYAEDLPGAAEIRKAKVTEAHNDELGEIGSSQISYAKTWSEFRVLFRSVFTNPTYLMLTLFTCCDNFIIAGFTAFGPKMFEVGFTFTAAVAGAVFGIVLIPAGAGGTIVGGVIIEKMKLSCQQIIRLQAILGAVVTAGIFLLLLSCPPLNFAGVNVSYNSSLSSNSLNLTDVCNVNCGCQFVDYDPICSHDNIVYFSPCHAGCNDMSEGSSKEFFNCSCISSPNGDMLSPSATSDTCTAEACSASIVFMVIFFFAVFFIFICITTNMTATLRCVISSQTSFAIGIQVLFIKALGTIIGPIFIGIAFDNTCTLWQESCGTRGSCLMYDNKDLVTTLFIICLTVKLISVVAMVIAVVVYKPPTSVQPIVNEVLEEQGQVTVAYSNGLSSSASVKDGEPTTTDTELTMTAKEEDDGSKENDAFSHL